RLAGILLRLKKDFWKSASDSSKTEVHVKRWKHLWQWAAVATTSWAVWASSANGADDAKASRPAPASFPKGGVFVSNVMVTLTNTAKEIRYTLDGSEPATNSPLYSAPLLLTNSALLQARAFADSKPGELLVETFTLLETNVTDFSSHLPLVVI